MNKIIKYIVSVLFIIMIFSLCLQVLARNIPGFHPVWTIELARYSMIFLIFFATALTVRNSELIAVDIFPTILKGKAKKGLVIFINLIVLSFFLLLVIYGYEIIGKVVKQTSATLKISMSIPYSSIIIGSTLASINCIAVIFEILLEKKNL